jgi:hypothetical protein
LRAGPVAGSTEDVHSLGYAAMTVPGPDSRKRIWL